MGTNVSKNVTETINETLVDQSKKVMNSTGIIVNSDLTASQMRNLKMKNVRFIGCTANFSQNIKIKNETATEISDTKEQDLANKLDQTLSANITNKVEQKIKDINVGATNVSNVRNYTKNKNYFDLSMRVANALRVNVNNAINLNQVANDDLEDVVWDCTKGGSYDASQNIDIDNVIKTAIDSDQVTEAVSEIAQKIETIALNDTMQSAIGFNPLALLALFIIPIIAVPVVLYVLKPKFGKAGFGKLNFGRRKLKRR